MRPVFYLYKVVLNGAHKLLPKGAVYIPKCVESKRCPIVSVEDGYCFGSGDAFQYHGRHSGIERGTDPCCQEGHVGGGEEGEAKVSKRAAAEVCVDRRCVRV